MCKTMNDIGIYIRELTTEEALLWLQSIFNEIRVIDESESIYQAEINGQLQKIQIQQGIENKNVCEIYFNPNHTPWENDEACARQAHKELNKVVFCDPEGDKYAPTQFIEFSVSGEKIIEF